MGKFPRLHTSLSQTIGLPPGRDAMPPPCTVDHPRKLLRNFELLSQEKSRTVHSRFFKLSVDGESVRRTVQDESKLTASFHMIFFTFIHLAQYLLDLKNTRDFQDAVFRFSLFARIPSFLFISSLLFAVVTKEFATS